MTKRILPLLLGLLAAPLAAQADVTEAPQFTLEQRTALRCSATFAIVAELQASGDAEALKDYPPLAERGQEFFVRSTAKVMDETGYDRATLTAALQEEARDLADPATRRAVMPVCLMMLDASGL